MEQRLLQEAFISFNRKSKTKNRKQLQLILALDTATEQGSLALVAADRVLMEYALESHGTYLTRLLPGVEALFANTGKELTDLAAVAVSLGPGNFTGLRIGLATAKTLAWSLKCPLVAVSTMEVLAAQFPFHPHPIGVVMDAKRGEVFWGLFRCPEDQPQVLEGPLRLPAADLPPRLPCPLLLTGPGLEVHLDVLTPQLSSEIVLGPPELRSPRAATLARLARQRLKQGLTANPTQLVPTYLRPAL
jgi:tRNA threonylcarbamoyladenosine biosynthesis protein TsaB